MAAIQLYNATTNAAIYPKIIKDCLSDELLTYLTENAAMKLSTGKEDVKASKLVVNEDVGFKLTNNAGICSLSLTVGSGMSAEGGKLSCGITAGTGLEVSLNEEGSYVIAIKEEFLPSTTALTQLYDLTQSSIEDEQIL